MTTVGWTGHPAWEEPALDLVHEHSGGIPRRINRLCARVLLDGALERAAVLTAEQVGITAEELTHDLGAIGAEAPLPYSEENSDALRALTERVDRLERTVGRRERRQRCVLEEQFVTVRDRG